MAKEIIICVDNHSIHFNPRLSIPIQHTNIPKEHLIFKSHKKIFWKVEQLSYTGTDQCLKVKVIDYESNDIRIFESQNPKNGIKKILFEKFHWPSLESLLSQYQKINLHFVLSNIDSNLFSYGDTDLKTIKPHPEKTFAQINASISDNEKKESDRTPLDNNRSLELRYNPSAIKTIKVEFSIKISDINFKLGYVSFSKKIKELNRSLNFNIPNDYILPEFDHIKFWFSRILKTSKINVTSTITLKDNEIEEIKSFSPEIDKITNEIIDAVKFQRTHGLMKSQTILTLDKSLFTADEIFNQFEENPQSNVFNQSEYDILQLLIDSGKIRNGKQLQYLSGAKHTSKNKLRYTLSPNFGFLFLVEGERCNHFIWELLDSHATYIWSIGKSEQELNLQYRRIEDIINTIRSSGREEYKRAYRNGHNDHDLIFDFVEHHQVSSNFVDGFPKWKSKLEEKLI